MGSNSRTSYWDSPEPEQESVLSFAPNVSFGSWSIEENCAGDLKLGRLGDLNNFVDRLRNPMASASSSGSYKRSRGHSNAMQVPSCLVDGCVTDLSNCRDYHRRHKVCEAHSKTPRVTIEGEEQRFCQQCSRFHSLAEFDDSKRSCRKRLDGHNRRRRKPQPDSLSLNSSKYIPTHQGVKFISYFPNNALATSSWNGGVKVPNSQLNFITNTFSGSFPQGYRGEKQFPFLYGADPSLHLNSMLGDAGSHSSRKLLFSDGFDPVISCDRASSLLSSSHADTCLFATPPSAPITAHYNGLAMESAPTMDSVLVACSNMDCPQMIQNASDDASHQTISFSWE